MTQMPYNAMVTTQYYRSIALLTDNFIADSHSMQHLAKVTEILEINYFLHLTTNQASLARQ
jgi:hypothetical protein